MDINFNLITRLGDFIEDELRDATLYRTLARIAPKEEDKRILMGFAKDEQSHAESFSELYHKLSGKWYQAENEPIVIREPYDRLIHQRVIAESEASRVYGKFALDDAKGKAFRDAFRIASGDEIVHALRLLYMQDD